MPWLFFAYPLLAHVATLLHSERLAWLAMTVLFAVPLWAGLRRGKGLAWLCLLIVMAVLYACATNGMTRYLMYLPPVLLPSLVLWVFARSLRRGEMPLVTRIATQIRGSLPAPLIPYTRKVTQCWVLLLAILALSSACLAVFATPELWSLMTNIVQYLVLASAFLGEYLYRRLRFRDLEHESFAALVAALFKTRMV